MRAAWTASGACTSGSTARPGDATRRTPGFAATTNTTSARRTRVRLRLRGRHGPVEESPGPSLVALHENAREAIGRAESDLVRRLAAHGHLAVREDPRHVVVLINLESVPLPTEAIGLEQLADPLL